MVKEAVETGLLYLCQTSRPDPFSYRGSGKRWVYHIKKHNPTIVTYILGIFFNMEDLREAGLYYSKLYKVVESDKWANLVMEQGSGGWINDQTGKRWKVSEEGRANMRRSRLENAESYKACRELFKERITGANNYQSVGTFVTPWGSFPTALDAVKEAKMQRLQGNKLVVTDNNTLIRYCKDSNIPTNAKGRRTPLLWRGKRPKEVGFDYIPNE